MKLKFTSKPLIYLKLSLNPSFAIQNVVLSQSAMQEQLSLTHIGAE